MRRFIFRFLSKFAWLPRNRETFALAFHVDQDKSEFLANPIELERERKTAFKQNFERGSLALSICLS